MHELAGDATRLAQEERAPRSAMKAMAEYHEKLAATALQPAAGNAKRVSNGDAAFRR